MRFQHLCLTGTGTCLYHQLACWLLSIHIFLHKLRTPNRSASFQLKPTTCGPPGENCCNSGTDTSPPAGAMIRRRKSVLLNRIHVRCSIFPPHLLPLFQRPLVFFRKPIPVAFISTLKMLLYSSTLSTFQRKKNHVSSFLECNLCPHYFLLAPEILWQKILVAIGLVSIPAFPSQHP